MASSRVKPSISAALRFHSLMLPVDSRSYFVCWYCYESIALCVD